jgi:hypothetical protein
MENNELVARENKSEIISLLVLNGDLSKMTPAQKVEYYNRFCDSLGLNPLTQPFAIIKLQGREILYSTKNCAEQLRRNNGVSFSDMHQEIINDLCVTTIKGSDKSGRMDVETGAVSIKGLTGDALANAMMKSCTKAKRRLTLSLCSVGVLDETEIETIPNTEKVEIRLGGEAPQTNPNVTPPVPLAVTSTPVYAVEFTPEDKQALVDACHEMGWAEDRITKVVNRAKIVGGAIALEAIGRELDLYFAKQSKSNTEKENPF